MIELGLSETRISRSLWCVDVLMKVRHFDLVID